ncbi:uncharacterized protein [Medicago truncatula]|uniref:Double-stranded RNA-binding motif protein n=2 Tax=Medicago truncatula TaxID=3880 RepID=A0A072ULP7_MEDTR|nr:uncharacterized protein LOC25496635 [Medicago truncatula]KEH26750.1 double-stranded RNA-binding motif protein [Medicago truncatula]
MNESDFPPPSPLPPPLLYEVEVIPHTMEAHVHKEEALIIQTCALKIDDKEEQSPKQGQEEEEEEHMKENENDAETEENDSPPPPHEVEAILEYEFKNKLLLEEAFTQRMIQEFTKGVAEYPLHSNGLIDVPKDLADIIESTIGAIFVDCNSLVETVWKVFKKLLEPIIDPNTIQRHPMAELHEVCHNKRLKLQFRDLWKESMRVEVLINEEFVGSGVYGSKKEIARNRAAKNVLQNMEIFFGISASTNEVATKDLDFPSKCDESSDATEDLSSLPKCNGGPNAIKDLHSPPKCDGSPNVIEDLGSPPKCNGGLDATQDLGFPPKCIGGSDAAEDLGFPISAMEVQMLPKI